MTADTATNVSNLIDAASRLAWPVSIVVLAIIFRKTISLQLERLKTLKAPGTEMTFADRLDEAVRESGKLTASLASQVTHERQAHLSLLVSTNPRKAINEAWELVREAAQEVARHRGMDWTTTKDLVVRLGRDEELSGEVVRLLLDMRNLRYEMVDQLQHDITSTTAAAYVAAAANAAYILRALPGGNAGRAATASRG